MSEEDRSDIPSKPRALLFHHVFLKGIQAGALVGLATFALRVPKFVRLLHTVKNKTSPNTDKK